ncbi:FIG054297: Transcriptional regulator, AraC family [hydrothermal vent metagenome]|uniref:FIG054297: Transcriptional regulator, AraC family n=1 Tax=hydrothermal vent metagenome TaxID=652676 RepID=A0A160TF67_9ZZZZ
MKPTWYECDQRYLPAHHQPALLLDLLLVRDAGSHKVLKGTGLFYEDIIEGNRHISALQFQQLISNSQKLAPEGDLSFRWGDNLWPGYYGLGSQLLSNAPDLKRALQALVQFRHTLSPLLVPRVFEDEHYCYVQWLETCCDLASLRPFMVETSMMALTSLSRWQSQASLPWRYGFSYQAPTKGIEQYQVHLGEQLMFGLGVDVMVIEKRWLERAWPKGSVTAFRASWHEATQSDPVPESLSGFCESVYDWLVKHIQQPVTLPDVALAFDMSSATLKRKLKKHRTSFQQIQDQARLHVCLYLLHVKGMNNEQVAQQLLFNDLTNFRRAFKRWSGLTPSASRQQFQLHSLAL